jgi:membrane-bound serine protease (ClpP class)
MRGRVSALVLINLLVAAALILAQPPRVIVVRLEGTIDEGLVYLTRKAVNEAQGGVLVVVLNSYGGYLRSADSIAEEILSCRCRTLAWVPPGSKAVSAATLVALAAQKLYLSRGAVIGAAKPSPPDEKVMEYVSSRLAGLLERRGVANATELARSMVYEARALTADKAVKLGVADGLAESLEELLSKEGLSGAAAEPVEPDLLRDVYSLIFNPLLAIAFLLLGALLLALEFHVAGFQGWGVAGAVLVLLALYTFNVVGLSLAAALLASLGAALLVLEFLKPGVQVFGVSGAVLLLLAILLVYYSSPFALSASAAAALAAVAVLCGLLAVIIMKGAEALRLRAPSLEERLVGKMGIARTAITPQGGVVLVESELWSAVSSEEIPPGSAVRVVGVDGLTLRVERLKDK